MSPTQTLYIIYNANASLLGKLHYTCRKLTSSKKDDPVCAACDITHGGLSLEETGSWKKAKEGLVGEGWAVRQFHRDELGGEIKLFVENEKLKFPVVIVGEEEASGKEGFRVLMGKEELAGFGGDAAGFVERVREKEKGKGVGRVGASL